MLSSSSLPLIAVDIGNARTKLGLFREHAGDRLPEPVDVFAVDNRGGDFGGLGDWVDSLDVPSLTWSIGSVNRPAATRLVDWLHDHRPGDTVVLLAASDLSMRVALPRPDMVGIDRLLDAMAADFLRMPSRPAVVVDVGTAITVDLVAADGSFRGGAILPGIAMSARALHEFTDLLPLVDVTELTTPPEPAGTSTDEAMQSGLFWGAVGSIRELINQMTSRLSEDEESMVAEADVFLTGGASPAVARLLGSSAHCVPQLTLAGIALATWAMK